MALALRVCNLNQSKRFLQEFISFGRTVTCFTYDRNNFKKSSPILQTRYTSTQANTNLEEPLLIYEGPSKMQIRRLKIFSFLTSIGGLLAQPGLYLKAASDDNMLAVVGISSVIGFFSIGTPLLIQVLAKRYVTDMYYYPKEDKYLANTYTLFLRTKKTKFGVDDVRVPEVTGIFTCCFVKKKALLFDENYFNDVSHYFRIMGYDKPIDFKLGTIDQDKVSSKSKDNVQIENK